MVIYREWVVETNSGQHKQRSAAWQKKIGNFIDEFVEKTTFPDIENELSGLRPRTEAVSLGQENQSVGFAMLALVLYRHTKHPGYLDMVQSEAMKALGRTSLSFGETEEEQLIENLICGRDPFDLDEGKEAAEACKV